MVRLVFFAFGAGWAQGWFSGWVGRAVGCCVLSLLRGYQATAWLFCLVECLKQKHGIRLG